MEREIKVGNYDGKLEDIAKKYDDKFTKIFCGKPYQEMVILFKKNSPNDYLIAISKPEIKNQDHNLVLNFCMEDLKEAKEIVKDFESKTKIKTREAPKDLKQRGLEFLSNFRNSQN